VDYFRAWQRYQGWNRGEWGNALNMGGRETARRRVWVAYPNVGAWRGGVGDASAVRSRLRGAAARLCPAAPLAAAPPPPPTCFDARAARIYYAVVE